MVEPTIAAFGRGYSVAEISGDNGLAGSLELRFDQKRRALSTSGMRPFCGLAHRLA